MTDSEWESGSDPQAVHPVGRRATLIRWLLAGLLVLYAATFICNWTLQPELPGRCFTEEQWNQIEHGMTLSDVQEILGCEPGEYSEFNLTLRVYSDPSPVKHPRFKWERGTFSGYEDRKSYAWKGPYGEIHLSLNTKTGVVMSTTWEALR